MPIFYYSCADCALNVRRILKSKEADVQNCLMCGKQLHREAKGPSTQMMETLDNGMMPKSVTRLVDIERLADEHRKSDPRLKKEPDSGEAP